MVEALDELRLRLRGRLHEELWGGDELARLRGQQLARPRELGLVRPLAALTTLQTQGPAHNLI